MNVVGFIFFCGGVRWLFLLLEIRLICLGVGFLVGICLGGGWKIVFVGVSCEFSLCGGVGD